MNKNIKIFQTTIDGVGTFCLRYPKVIDQIEIARLRAEKYLYGVRYEWDIEAKKDVALGIDTQSLGLATIMCELIVCTEKKPDDFEYHDCDDLLIITEIYDQFDKWRSDFRESKTTPPNKDGTGQTA